MTPIVTLGEQSADRTNYIASGSKRGSRTANDNSSRADYGPPNSSHAWPTRQ